MCTFKNSAEDLFETLLNGCEWFKILKKHFKTYEICKKNLYNCLKTLQINNYIIKVSLKFFKLFKISLKYFVLNLEL